MFIKRSGFLSVTLKGILSVALAGSALGLAVGPAAQADALPLLPAPVFSQSEAMDVTFCAEILNFDAAATYTFTQVQGLPARGYVWQFNNRNLACAEVANSGETAQFDVTVSKPGALNNHAMLTGTSLASTQTQITFSNYMQTPDGFTVEINPKTIPDETWTLSVTRGSASFVDSTHILVSGLTEGQVGILQVLISRPNYYLAPYQFQGAALSAAEIAARVAAEAAAKSAADKEASRAAVEKATKDYIEAQQTIKDQQLALQQKMAAEKLAADTQAVNRFTSMPTSGQANSVISLTSDQVALIPVKLVRDLTPKTIARINVAQASGITAAQLRALTIPQLKALRPATIGAISPDAFSALSVAKLKSLSKAQIKQIWFGQVAQLDADQRKALRR